MWLSFTSGGEMSHCVLAVLRYSDPIRQPLAEQSVSAASSAVNFSRDD